MMTYNQFLHTMEGEVCRSLLQGNDTQCFTTEQYGIAVDNWIARFIGRMEGRPITRQELGVEDPGLQARRNQLKGCFPYIVECSPDVWKEGETYQQPIQHALLEGNIVA